MGNVLEFLIRLKDQLAPGMTQAARVSNSAAAQIQGGIDRANGSSRRMSASIDELKKRLESVNKTRVTTRMETEFKNATHLARELESQIARLEKPRGGGAGGFLAGMGKQLLAYASIGAVMSFGASSLAAANDFGVKNKTYEVLTGSKTRGEAMSGQLLDLKQNTIMGASVYGNAQTMMGFGIDRREIIKDLRQIGDISMGNVDRMQALTLAFSQTHAAGRLMGQDLLQYINAGFNPLQVMSERWKEFGLKHKVSIGQLKDMMSEGQISSAAVKKAFELATSEGGRYYGMMKMIAETTQGKLQLMKGHYAAFQISVGQSMQPIAGYLFDVASSVLKVLSNTKTVSDQMTDQIVKVRALQLELTSSNTSEARRVQILREMQDINPNITKGINDQSIEYSKLAANINSVVAALNSKRIAANLEDDNADKIAKYNKAYNTTAQSSADLFSLLVKINPDLAGRTDLSAGQKTQEARKFLQQRMASGNTTMLQYAPTGSVTGGSAPTTTTQEAAYLAQLNHLVYTNNQAVSTIKELQPGVLQVQKNIKTATDAYNRMFDQGKTPTGKKGKGSAGSTEGGTDTSELITGGTADAINKGGQRNITITIGKQIEHLDIHVMGKEEAGIEIAHIVREEMVRVLHSLNGSV